MPDYNLNWVVGVRLVLSVDDKLKGSILLDVQVNEVEALAH